MIQSFGRLEIADQTESFNTSSFVEALYGVSILHASVLVLDNVVVHHSAAVKEHATANGVALLFLPSYSLWLNPVESVISVGKRKCDATVSIG